jgi:hypothetical protein
MATSNCKINTIFDVSRVEAREKKHECSRLLVEFHRDIFKRRYRKGCMILGFNHGVKENLALLRFYAVLMVCCIKYQKS